MLRNRNADNKTTLFQRQKQLTRMNLCNKINWITRWMSWATLNRPLQTFSTCAELSSSDCMLLAHNLVCRDKVCNQFGPLTDSPHNNNKHTRNKILSFCEKHCSNPFSTISANTRVIHSPCKNYRRKIFIQK